MKIRVKHRQMPGDISKREKIFLREKSNTKSAKKYRKMLRARERAVFKRQSRREIMRQLFD